MLLNPLSLVCLFFLHSDLLFPFFRPQKVCFCLGFCFSICLSCSSVRSIRLLLTEREGPSKSRQKSKSGAFIFASLSQCLCVFSARFRYLHTNIRNTRRLSLFPLINPLFSFFLCFDVSCHLYNIFRSPLLSFSFSFSTFLSLFAPIRHS